jgi:hypothetical protein
MNLFLHGAADFKRLAKPRLPVDQRHRGRLLSKLDEPFAQRRQLGQL